MDSNIICQHCRTSIQVSTKYPFCINCRHRHTLIKTPGKVKFCLNCTLNLDSCVCQSKKERTESENQYKTDMNQKDQY